jgi:hypothetical protein
VSIAEQSGDTGTGHGGSGICEQWKQKRRSGSAEAACEHGKVNTTATGVLREGLICEHGELKRC